MQLDGSSLTELHAAYARGGLRFVVGSAASTTAGLPDGRALDERMLRGLLARDESLKHLQSELPAVRSIAEFLATHFGADSVGDAVRQALARTSSSREETEKRTAALVREALYGAASGGARARSAGPLHLELVAALCDPKREQSARLVTFNVDDRLEAAAATQGAVVHVAADATTGATPGKAFVHVRGYVPQTGDAQGQTILSEREMASGDGRWATSVLEDLVAGPARHELLLVGPSLLDVGLRHMLATRLRTSDRRPSGRVYALLWPQPDDDHLDHAEGGDGLPRFARRVAADWGPAFWRAWQVEPIVLPNADLAPHALRCVRLGPQPAASADAARAWLASKSAYHDLYSEKRQKAAASLLRSALRHVRSRFAVPRDEEVHVGVHVPADDDPRALRIAFHFVGEQEGTSLLPNELTLAAARQRELSIGGPGEPEGATGRAYVTGAVVRSHVGDDKLDENFPPEKAHLWHGPRTFQSLLSIPISSPDTQHVPVAVLYLNSNRPQPFWSVLDDDDVRDLCRFCSRVVLGLLRAD